MIFSVSNIYSINEVDSLVNVLEKELAIKDVYVKYHNNKIWKIKSDLESSKNINEIYRYQDKLYTLYKSFRCDSAIHYLEKNIILSSNNNLESELLNSELKLVFLLSSSGMYKEAFDIIDTIKIDNLTDDFKQLAYLAYDRIFGELAFYSQANILRDSYIEKSEKYKRELYKILDKESDLYLSMLETKLRDASLVDSALIINDLRLKNMSLDSINFPLISFHRSLSYKEKGDELQRKKYLLLSSIYDVRNATKDNASLILLANIFFDEGDIDRAYNFIRHSMDDANFFNAKLRNMQVSEIQPIIDEAYFVKNENQKYTLRLLLFLASIFSFISLVFIVIVYFQKKRLQKAHAELKHFNTQLKDLNSSLTDLNSKLKDSNSSLAEANHVKEEYIGLFLSIYSTYITKLDNMRRMVNKEIRQGKVPKLLDYVSNEDFMDEELNEFYNIFDKTFLNLYPNFVKEFNNLLKPEERFEVKSGDTLNTELRIFALIRLGIYDSSKIAGLLRYSVNTIYNYRAKIKNKAIVPREDFEKIIATIDSIKKVD